MFVVDRLAPYPAVVIDIKTISAVSWLRGSVRASRVVRIGPALFSGQRS